jgi:hypothetical protein
VDGARAYVSMMEMFRRRVEGGMCIDDSGAGGLFIAASGQHRAVWASSRRIPSSLDAPCLFPPRRRRQPFYHLACQFRQHPISACVPLGLLSSPVARFWEETASPSPSLSQLHRPPPTARSTPLVDPNTRHATGPTKPCSSPRPCLSARATSDPLSDSILHTIHAPHTSTP